MLGSKVIALVALALGASAAPFSAEGKAFKLGVTVGGKTLYLTETTTATTDVSKAVECAITGGKIACGQGKKGLTYGDMHTSLPLQPTSMASNNKHWTISDSGSISWKQSSGKDVHISTKGGNQLYAEICSSNGHPDGLAFKPGTIRAYWV